MTIEEFARQIGVSPSTVSRTISGGGRISATTRQRVLRQMQELGYTPNATAQRLAVGKTNTILFECGEIPPFDLFMLEVIRGVQRTVARYGYGMLLNSPNADPVGTVVGDAVDGAILVRDDVGDITTDETLTMAWQIVERNKICVVIAHAPVPDPRIGTVVLDLQAGVRQLARALVEQGHRQIGFIGSRSTETVLGAFRDELVRLGIEQGTSSRLHTVVTGNTSEDGERGMYELMHLPKEIRPTAVFARNDTLASGALRMARQLGLRVPTDVSLAGHDDVPFAPLVEPPLTTVRIDCARLGELAAEMLIRRLRPGMISGEEDPALCRVPTTLVWRESVAPPSN